ncbi:MAG TPA: hypothetical protein VFT66_00680 [Roseiflexaceae bacterium]|nr:hypothetical protein [Roseiflexaceae bacterium]
MKNRNLLFTLTTLVSTLVLAACQRSAAPTIAPTNQPVAVADSTVAPTNAPPTSPAATAAGASATAPASASSTNSSAATAGGQPVFSKPLEITNPYYPIAPISQTISIGTEDGKSARVEVTLLPDAKTISWAGGNTQVRTAQFVAYSEDQLVEIAYDYFAQADNGDVYYFGEEVANYEDGQVKDHEGTWMAGKDGAPPALIMPAHPQIGMVFNPENLPGVVYETDEILSMSEKTTTPKGPISDGMLVKETMMDNSIEHKLYASGFGIVEDRSSDDEKVSLVVVNRADAAPGTVPTSLQTIEAQAEAIIDDVPGGDWAKVGADLAPLADAWKAYQAQATADGAPQVLQDAFATALSGLQQAAAAKNAADTMQGANDVSAAVMDLFSVYHPATPADLGRLDVFEREVVLDAGDEDLTAVADDLAKIDAIWARLEPSVLAHSGADAAKQFEASVAAQQAALKAKDGSALTAEANKALELVDALEQLY